MWDPGLLLHLQPEELRIARAIYHLKSVLDPFLESFNQLIALFALCAPSSGVWLMVNLHARYCAVNGREVQTRAPFEQGDHIRNSKFGWVCWRCASRIGQRITPVLEFYSVIVQVSGNQFSNVLKWDEESMNRRGSIFSAPQILVWCTFDSELGHHKTWSIWKPALCEEGCCHNLSYDQLVLQFLRRATL